MMGETFGACWQNWLLMLAAIVLIFRTGFYAVELLMRWRRSDFSGLAAMLTRRSRAYEWESRLMTFAVALAAIAFSLGWEETGRFILMTWMGFRIARFAGNRAMAVSALLMLCLVSTLAGLGERL